VTIDIATARRLLELVLTALPVQISLQVIGEEEAPEDLLDALGAELFDNALTNQPRLWMRSAPEHQRDRAIAWYNALLLEQRPWGEQPADPALARLCMLATAKEAAGAFRLPIPPESGYLPGLLVRDEPFVLPHAWPQAAERTLVLGEILHRGRPTGQQFHIAVADLVRHGLVAGATGAGKTTTCQGLLAQLWSQYRIPFLILYPIDKPDYRVFLADPRLREELLIFTVGDENTAPFRFNPFVIADGVPLRTHLSLLMRCISAAFTMWDPLPAIYRAALRQMYTACGWDVDRDVGGAAGRRVAIVGLDSGGSQIASALARAGVGDMRLVDHDRLAVHNIARHACGLNDVGRYKTRAMRDILTGISPFLQVATFEVDILRDEPRLEAIVDGCDIVIAATDNEPSKQAINRVCWARGIPAIYGAAYARALGGEVFRALPAEGPCYNCFSTQLAEFFAEPPASTDFSPGYADPAKMAELVAAPGLGMDVGVIALLTARAALSVLLRGTPTILADLPTNLVLFGNRAEWIFRKPLESIFCEIPQLPDCPVCRSDEYAQAHLKMTATEARHRIQGMLATLPELPDAIAADGTAVGAGSSDGDGAIHYSKEHHY
jgi:molybdopterin/thiamine biosynthesis adenylyltransferase